MSKFIFDEKENIFFQKDAPNGWCVVVQESGDAWSETIDTTGLYIEYAVSDGVPGKRSFSSDHLSLQDALKECIEFNKKFVKLQNCHNDVTRLTH